MTVYTLNPLSDPRWVEFVDRHESASVFHTAPWLEAIRQTYGYTPVVYTTSPPSSPLANGVVLCQIKSWLTGQRMVSLPFSDHCDPLLDTAGTATVIAEELKRTVDAGKWKYVELRPTGELSGVDGVTRISDACLHMLDISAPAEELLRRTHKTSIQQRVRRAEREGITIECGNSERLIGLFFRLLLQTRRRHQLPPQPIDWFKRLVSCMGDRLQIRVAFKDGIEIASIVTLKYKNILVYKYGCSDARFKNIGATPYLLWNAILEAKEQGITSMDFGRSDHDNPGLISFKDGWGGKSTPLVYLRWSRQQGKEANRGHASSAVKRLFSIMPDFMLETAGRILYRHIG